MLSLHFLVGSRALALALCLLGGCAAPADETEAAHAASPPLAPPSGADVLQISSAGQDVATLEPHAVPGKITLFDFYATWCTPCRKLDEHVYALLERRTDIAVRKLDIGAWESPAASHWLGDVAELPYVVVFDKRGRKLKSIVGLELAALDAAIAEASR